MTDIRFRKMLMTIRAALIMATKAIEEYCKEGGEVVPVTSDGITTVTYGQNKPANP